MSKFLDSKDVVFQKHTPGGQNKITSLDLPWSNFGPQNSVLHCASDGSFGQGNVLFSCMFRLFLHLDTFKTGTFIANK